MAVGEATDVMYGRDAGVLELSRDPRLSQESLGGRPVGGEAVLQNLDRHFPVQCTVVGAVDVAHATAADQFE